MPSIINSDDGVVSGTSGLKTTGGNDGLLNIQTNGSTAISISSGQRSTFPTTIGVGNATPSTSGSGITFPATQSASTDANTLDDYEEGTWTPTDSSPGTVGLTSASGYYIKIGKLVYASARFFYNTNSNSSSAVVGGLPFNSTGGGFPVGYCGYTTCNTVVNFRAASGLTFYISNAATGADITAATLSNKEIQMTFIYAAA